VMYALHIYLIISKLYKVDTIIPNSEEILRQRAMMKLAR